MSRSASPLTIINTTITPTTEVTPSAITLTTPSATTLTSRTLTKMKLNPTVTPTSDLIKDHELLWIKKKTPKSDSRRRCFLCMKGDLGKNNVKKVKFACNKFKVPFCLECFWISHHHPDYKHYSEELPQKNMYKVDPCILLYSAIISNYVVSHGVWQPALSVGRMRGRRTVYLDIGMVVLQITLNTRNRGFPIPLGPSIDQSTG